MGDESGQSISHARPEAGSISVVIVSKDEPELEETLVLLEPQCQALGAECIVVDASNGRLDAIRLRHSFVEWIDFVGPFGVTRTIAHQRNIGVRAARGDIIAFADSGGIPSPDWLAEVTAPLRDGRAVAVCGPVHSLHPSPYPVYNDLGDGERVFLAVTCNMAFRRKVFDAVGGFDERFADGEDCDFGWRAEDHGMGFVGVPRARMLANHGGEQRWLRRARLYGASTARLLATHPDRIWEMFLASPDIFIYPAWEIGLAGSILLIPWVWWAPLPWLGVFLIPVARNFREPQALVRLRIRLTKALWFCIGWGALVLDRGIPVAFIPQDRVNPYQPLLCDGLAGAGVAVDYLDHGPTPSRTFNRFLGPARLGWRRIRGTKVVHVHYAYAFALPWTRRVPGLHRLPRWWMRVWMATAKLVGLRLVYSAHDLEQHTPQFDDDKKAQETLLRHADAVICLSDANSDALRTAFPDVAPMDIAVIPMGPPADVETSGRDQIRRRLEIRPDDIAIVAAGRLEWYKGFDLVLDALASAPPETPVVVRFAGLCNDSGYRRVLEDSVARARAAGIDARVDLRHLPEWQLEELLVAGDIAVFPFRQITNSSSLQRAAARHLAILIPDLASLRDIPEDAVARFVPDEAGSLRAALDELFRMTPTERAARAQAAYAWTRNPSWAEVGALTRKVYERVLRPKQSQTGDAVHAH